MKKTKRLIVNNNLIFYLIKDKKNKRLSIVIESENKYWDLWKQGGGVCIPAWTYLDNSFETIHQHMKKKNGSFKCRVFQNDKYRIEKILEIPNVFQSSLEWIYNPEVWKKSETFYELRKLISKKYPEFFI